MNNDESEKEVTEDDTVIPQILSPELRAKLAKRRIETRVVNRKKQRNAKPMKPNRALKKFMEETREELFRKGFQPIAMDDRISTPEMMGEITRKMVGIYNTIVNSINEGDLADLSIKEKIDLLIRLMKLHDVVKVGKGPSSVTFNQVNIESAGREELENALMSVATEE